jgi:alpha-L-fucosidase 2
LVTSFFKEYAAILKAFTGKRFVEIEKKILLLPTLDTNETGLTISPGYELKYSHRHLSPYMGVYPLQLLNIDNHEDSATIKKSIHHIEEKGTRAWCGYSFSWMANIYASAKEADSAVKMLKIFATNFCGINSFHLNGDQKGGRYSGFTYRPFTLEGNLAFAQGVQELLLQSQNDIVQVFPAVPQSWKNISFTNLRAQGAFLISAKKENGKIADVKIFSEKGGILKMKLPFLNFNLQGLKRAYTVDNNMLTYFMQPKEEIILKHK